MIHNIHESEHPFNAEGTNSFIELTDRDLAQVQGAWGGSDDREFPHERDDWQYHQNSWNGSDIWRYRQNDWWNHRKHRWFHRDHDDWNRR